MTARTWVLLAGAVGLLQTGCSTMNHTERGALGGGAVGAGVGALISNATGNTGAGAAIGGLGGALLGGAIGNDADKRDQEVADLKQAQAEQAYRDDQPTRIGEIIDLTNSGTDEAVILNHMRNNRMTFRLSADDIKLLNANKVSPRVIAAMQSSGDPVVVTRPPRPVVVREQVIVHEPVFVHRRPPPVVFVDPYCPPTGFHIHGRFRH